MKINYKQKALTLGEFIASVYDAHDKYKARGMVRLAIILRPATLCDFLKTSTQEQKYKHFA